MIHKLKMCKKHFKETLKGHWLFKSMGKNHYQQGDILIVREYNQRTQKATGRELKKIIEKVMFTVK